MGGTETMLVDIINEQIKTNSVILIVINDLYQNDLLAKLDSRVKIKLLNRKVGSRSLWPIIKLNALLYYYRADVVHLHNENSVQLLLPQIGRKIILTVHALNLPLKGLNRISSLISISEAVNKDVFDRYGYASKTIYNGIHNETIDYRKQCDDFDKKGMQVVQVANLLQDLKGQDILMKAIGLLHRRGIKNIDVHFIGKGEAMYDLKKLSEEEGVSSMIHFHGGKDRKWIYAHLKDFDVMCHPARFEGFGLSIIEGMVACLPLVVPDNGGPYEVVANGKYGYTFNEGSVEDCAESLAYVYEHYQEAYKKAIAARNFAMQNYSVVNTANLYLEEYVRG